MKFKIHGKDTVLRHVETLSLIELQHALRFRAALEELNKFLEEMEIVVYHCPFCTSN